jgi:hypothetical protein
MIASSASDCLQQQQPQQPPKGSEHTHAWHSSNLRAAVLHADAAARPPRPLSPADLRLQHVLRALLPCLLLLLLALPLLPLLWLL